MCAKEYDLHWKRSEVAIKKCFSSLISTQSQNIQHTTAKWPTFYKEFFRELKT